MWTIIDFIRGGITGGENEARTAKILSLVGIGIGAAVIMTAVIVNLVTFLPLPKRVMSTCTDDPHRDHRNLIKINCNILEQGRQF